MKSINISNNFSKTVLNVGTVYDIVTSTGHEFKVQFVGEGYEEGKLILIFHDINHNKLFLRPSFIVSRFESYWSDNEEVKY